MRLDPVSRRYAAALYETAEKHGRVETVSAGLHRFRETLKQYPELRRFLQSFRMRAGEKARIIRNIFADELDEFVLNALATLLKNQRYGLVEELPLAFQREVRIHQNIELVHAVTAIPLSGDLRDRVVALLEQQLRKKIELTERVDESLIGGIRIQIENTVYDGSIAHQLQKLRKSLS
ncbi:MAG TPA: ATP synthase F1 subunit delta [bacterium]|nr:ATP synthase F1 subunit delta [bacterium]